MAENLTPEQGAAQGVVEALRQQVAYLSGLAQQYAAAAGEAKARVAALERQIDPGDASPLPGPVSIHDESGSLIGQSGA